MPKLHTLKLRITEKQFLSFFSLDSPGMYLAKEALESQEISGPREVLETLCLMNELYGNLLLIAMTTELSPYGKAKEYMERRGEPGIGDFVVDTLGKERAAEIMRDVMARVREECKIGTGENEKAAPSQKSARKKRRRG